MKIGQEPKRIGLMTVKKDGQPRGALPRRLSTMRSSGGHRSYMYKSTTFDAVWYEKQDKLSGAGRHFWNGFNGSGYPDRVTATRTMIFDMRFQDLNLAMTIARPHVQLVVVTSIHS